MSISAEVVRQLREETGAGMMDCKGALVEAQGDMEKARDLLRKKGLAAASPAAAQYVSKDEVPAQVLEKEKEIYRAQAVAQGKPANVVDRIAEGKVKEYYATFCLLEQPFVKDPKLTVGQLVQEKIAVIKENIVIRRFARFRLGEESGRKAATE